MVNMSLGTRYTGLCYLLPVYLDSFLRLIHFLTISVAVYLYSSNLASFVFLMLPARDDLGGFSDGPEEPERFRIRTESYNGVATLNGSGTRDDGCDIVWHACPQMHGESVDRR
jgi:hypothetical protein